MPSGWVLTTALTCPTARRCIAGAMGTAGPGIIKTVNGGSTWAARALPQPIGRVAAIRCPTKTRCTAVGSRSSTGVSASKPISAVTSNGGRQWSEVPLPRPFVLGGPTGLSCIGASVCIAVGATSASAPAGTTPPSAVILRTANGGRSWRTAAIPAGFARVRAVSCSKSSTCVAVVNGASQHPTASPGPYGPSVAWTTPDSGAQWTTGGRIGTGQLTSVSCAGRSRCWAVGAVAGSAALEGSTNAGRSWTSSTIDGPASDVQYASSVSCPSRTVCEALGAQAANGTDTPVALRNS